MSSDAGSACVSLQMLIDWGLLEIGALVLPASLRFPCGQLSECTGSHGYTSRRGNLSDTACLAAFATAPFGKLPPAIRSLFLSLLIPKPLEVLHSRVALAEFPFSPLCASHKR